jgi:hypothetical protein
VAPSNGAGPGSAAADREAQKVSTKHLPSKLHKSDPQIALYYGGARTPLVHVEPDDQFPGMYRLAWPDGLLSDIVNYARAKDAAAEICERGLPRRDRRLLHWKITARDKPTAAAGAFLSPFTQQ